MEFKPKRNILLLRPDTIEHVYRNINLAKPGEMEDAIKTVRDWVNMQPHFRRKDFTDNFIRSAIIASKGSIEVAKQRLDKICTMRSLMPDIFRGFDVKTYFDNFNHTLHSIVLPKLTKDHYRVFIVKVPATIDSTQITNAFKYTIMVSDYMRQCDYVAEYVGILDLLHVNLVDLLTNLNVIELQRILNVYFEGHGMRVKGVYFVTTSKLIDSLILILKQIMKPKLIQRIKVFSNWDEVHDFIEKEILPVDFGGFEKSEKEIHDAWIEELSDEDFKKYLKDINSASTDENCRPSHKFSVDYAGMPGTFRLLSVD